MRARVRGESCHVTPGLVKAKPKKSAQSSSKLPAVDCEPERPLRMASSWGEGEGGAAWRRIGAASELSGKRCRLVYSSLGPQSDVCLVFAKGEFFALDARCAHSGGPLCEGDIEDADGILRVFCPWHDYSFDLRTGLSGTSLRQQVHEVRLEDGDVYVKHASCLSLQPFPVRHQS